MALKNISFAMLLRIISLVSIQLGIVFLVDPYCCNKFVLTNVIYSIWNIKSAFL